MEISNTETIVLVIRKSDVDKFQAQGFTLDDTGAKWPWRLEEWMTTAILTKTHDRSWPPCRWPIETHAPFIGVIFVPDGLNPRIVSEWLIASADGKTVICPGHGYKPCIPLHDQNIPFSRLMVEADSLSQVGAFSKLWWVAQLRVRQTAAA